MRRPSSVLFSATVMTLLVGYGCYGATQVTVDVSTDLGMLDKTTVGPSETKAE